MEDKITKGLLLQHAEKECNMGRDRTHSDNTFTLERLRHDLLQWQCDTDICVRNTTVSAPDSKCETIACWSRNQQWCLDTERQWHTYYHKHVWYQCTTNLELKQTGQGLVPLQDISGVISTGRRCPEKAPWGLSWSTEANAGATPWNWLYAIYITFSQLIYNYIYYNWGTR